MSSLKVGYCVGDPRSQADACQFGRLIAAKSRGDCLGDWCDHSLIEDPLARMAFSIDHAILDSSFWGRKNPQDEPSSDESHSYKLPSVPSAHPGEVRLYQNRKQGGVAFLPVQPYKSCPRAIGMWRIDEPRSVLFCVQRSNSASGVLITVTVDGDTLEDHLCGWSTVHAGHLDSRRLE